MRPLKVLLLEPHDGGSHRAVSDALLRRSRHKLTKDALPARNWKWRLRAAGLVFASRHARSVRSYDLVLISTAHKAANYRELALWARQSVDTRNAMAGIRTRKGLVTKA